MLDVHTVDLLASANISFGLEFEVFFSFNISMDGQFDRFL
jgi:hypothetical protein